MAGISRSCSAFTLDNAGRTPALSTMAPRDSCTAAMGLKLAVGSVRLVSSSARVWGYRIERLSSPVAAARLPAAAVLPNADEAAPKTAAAHLLLAAVVAGAVRQPAGEAESLRVGGNGPRQWKT